MTDEEMFVQLADESARRIRTIREMGLSDQQAVDATLYVLGEAASIVRSVGLDPSKLLAEFERRTAGEVIGRERFVRDTPVGRAMESLTIQERALVFHGVPSQHILAFARFEADPTDENLAALVVAIGFDGIGRMFQAVAPERREPIENAMLRIAASRSPA
jgi:hypothetical protein